MGSKIKDARKKKLMSERKGEKKERKRERRNSERERGVCFVRETKSRVMFSFFSSPTALLLLLLILVRRTILHFHEEAQLVEGEPHFDEMNRVEKG